MYKYEYETIHTATTGFGFGSGTYLETEDYKKIIDTRAADGWRYVGFVPSLQRGSGQIELLDLVFEKADDNGAE